MMSDFFQLPEELQHEGFKQLQKYMSHGGRLADINGISSGELNDMQKTAERFYLAGKYNEATSLAAYLAFLGGKKSEHWEFLGLCLVKIKQYEPAKMALAHALRLNIKSPLPVFYMAQIVEIESGFEEARHLYTKALELCHLTDNKNNVKKHVMKKLRK